MTPENRWARAVAEIAARDGITVDEASTNLASLLASLPPAPRAPDQSKPVYQHELKN